MKIGSLQLKNNVLLAPMAGITNLPFRIIARKFGCGLAFTEMVSANGLVRKTGKSYRYMDSSPDDKPLGVQIFGSDSSIMAVAAHIAAERGADIIDINMGCPVRKVVRTGSGAALMKDIHKAELILKEVRKSISLPLTVKIRSGWNKDDITAFETARLAEDCGADAVIVHPRTVSQGFGGSADWNIIALIKRNLNIPVIGSGDIKTPYDAERMLVSTGCDGLMIGRAALGSPWIFHHIISSLNEGTAPEFLSSYDKLGIIKEHMNMEINYSGESIGLRSFRKHLLWYTKGAARSAQFRQKIGEMNDMNVILHEIENFLQVDEKREDTDWQKNR